MSALTVKKYDVTINEGNIETMAVTVLPANATNKKLQYTTSDNNVATVDNKGVITAIAQGSCKVTAETMDGSNRSVSVNVTVTKTQRPRCIITQDAEVDDMNSLIHVLLYSNEVDIQGIVQSSSKFHWKGVAGQKEEKYTKPYRWPGTEWMQKYLNAYQKIYPNLKKHDKSYPAPAYLKSVTKVGNIGYKGEMDSATEGSELIKKTILDNDERTLYLLAWGGTNTISRALKDIEKEYKGTKQWDAIRKKIINKVVIPACGEQDETYSEYIAEEWPEIKFMSCSQMSSYAYMWRTQPEDSSKKTLYAGFMLKNLIRKHGALLDNYVTWGDGTYLDGEEPGSQFGTNEDLLDSLNWWGGFNPVQKYQRYDFLSEGDSPTFFMLLDTGLRTLEDITNGGFSGRYARADKKNSKGQEVNYWSPVTDTYVKEDGSTMKVESSWKYIDDIQNDFAARADWCIVNDYVKANHAPKVSVTEGTDIKASAGETLKLHAIATDPDDDYVTVSWSEYTDASTTETALTLNGRYSKMKVQIEVGKGIQCDGIEIMFGDSISSVVKAVGEVDKYEDNYYFYESSLLVHVDSNKCIDEIEIRTDEEHSHVVMLNGTNIFSEMKDVVIELIVRLNQSPVEDELGTYEAKRIGLAYSFSMTDEEIEEMISEAKEEGTYEEMKEEIEADIKRAKYLQTISIRKTK